MRLLRPAALAALAAVCLSAQVQQIPDSPLPTFRSLNNDNWSWVADRMVAKFTGSGVPTTVSGAGYLDLYMNSITYDLYYCASTSGTCSSVAAGQWTLVGSSGSGGGLADPGQNGPIKRTSLNTTAKATAADIYGLFTGTPSSSVFLRADGTLAAPTTAVACSVASSAPSSPVGGQCYYDSAKGMIGVYTGSAWKYYLATDGASGFSFTADVQAAPVTPSSGQVSCWIDSTLGTFACKDSAGAVTSLVASQNPIGCGFYEGGTVLSSSVVGCYFTMTRACTLVAWHSTVDSGTIAFDIDRVAAAATSLPAFGSPALSGSVGPGVASNQIAHSTTFTSWTSTAVAKNDVIGIRPRSVTGSPTTASFVMECQ